MRVRAHARVRVCVAWDRARAARTLAIGLRGLELDSSFFHAGDDLEELVTGVVRAAAREADGVERGRGLAVPLAQRGEVAVAQRERRREEPAAEQVDARAGRLKRGAARGRVVPGRDGTTCEVSVSPLAWSGGGVVLKGGESLLYTSVHTAATRSRYILRNLVSIQAECSHEEIPDVRRDGAHERGLAAERAARRLDARRVASVTGSCEKEELLT